MQKYFNTSQFEGMDKPAKVQSLESFILHANTEHGYPLNHQRLSYVTIGAALRSVPKTIESKPGPIHKKFIALITSLKMQSTLESNLHYLKCTTAITKK